MSMIITAILVPSFCIFTSYFPETKMNNVALTPKNLLKSDNARPDPEVFPLLEGRGKGEGEVELVIAGILIIIVNSLLLVLENKYIVTLFPCAIIKKR